MKARALAILHPGFEEAEAVVPIDLLRRADVEVALAHLGDGPAVESRCGLKIEAQDSFQNLERADYDLVFLPGGPGIREIRRHPGLCALLRRQAEAERWIACICAAPLLLLDAGLAEGIELTCHPSAEKELGEVLDRPVVQSGRIITSRGAGTATQLGLALVACLRDKAAAREVAESICWPYPA